MSAQEASPEMPARWITAEAPRQAAVIASMSVTEARITSSAGPAVMSVMSSRRRVRPGRASRGRSMDPISPAAPVMRIVGTAANITRSSGTPAETLAKRGQRGLLGVGLRVRGGAGAGQEPEVAALVGLGDLLAEQDTVAAPEPGRRWLPGSTAPGQLSVVHLHPQHPLSHV